MRMILAMVFAATAAAAATLFVSHGVADSVVAAARFDTPGEVARTHMAVYMAVNILALLGGWVAGWLIGYPLRRRPPPA